MGICTTVSIESGAIDGLNSIIDLGFGNVLQSPRHSCGHLQGAIGEFLFGE